MKYLFATPGQDPNKVADIAHIPDIDGGSSTTDLADIDAGSAGEPLNLLNDEHAFGRELDFGGR